LLWDREDKGSGFSWKDRGRLPSWASWGGGSLANSTRDCADEGRMRLDVLARGAPPPRFRLLGCGSMVAVAPTRGSSGSTWLFVPSMAVGL